MTVREWLAKTLDPLTYTSASDRPYTPQFHQGTEPSEVIERLTPPVEALVAALEEVESALSRGYARPGTTSRVKLALAPFREDR